MAGQNTRWFRPPIVSKSLTTADPRRRQGVPGPRCSRHQSKPGRCRHGDATANQRVRHQSCQQIGPQRSHNTQVSRIRNSLADRFAGRCQSWNQFLPHDQRESCGCRIGTIDLNRRFVRSTATLLRTLCRQVLLCPEGRRRAQKIDLSAVSTALVRKTFSPWIGI